MAIPKGQRYDLEQRTLEFAKACRTFVRRLPRTIANVEDGRQLIRSSDSVGANYIEANQALSKKDFRLRVKICRKEAMESSYWLSLLHLGDGMDVQTQRDALRQERTGAHVHLRGYRPQDEPGYRVAANGRRHNPPSVPGLGRQGGRSSSPLALVL